MSAGERLADMVVFPLTGLPVHLLPQGAAPVSFFFPSSADTLPSISQQLT